MMPWVLAIGAIIVTGVVSYALVYLGCCRFIKDTTP
jgi:hypothetical protein